MQIEIRKLCNNTHIRNIDFKTKYSFVRNVRSVNQGKLEVVKEMARVNMDILKISELKWTRTGNFNSDAHYIFYCEQEFFRRNGIAIIVNKSIQNAVLECNLKNDRMISVCIQGNHSLSQ